MSGGILLEKGCEALEILRSFFGDAVSYSSSSERGFVSGMADYNTDDIFSALVRFSSGATAEILCGNFGDTDCGLRFKLYAPGKRLEYTRDEVRIYGETFDPGKTKKMLHAGEILPDEVTDECLIFKRNPAVSAESAFVSAVENNLPELAADYEKGLETLKLAMKMRKGTL